MISILSKNNHIVRITQIDNYYGNDKDSGKKGKNQMGL